MHSRPFLSFMVVATLVLLTTPVRADREPSPARPGLGLGLAPSGPDGLPSCREHDRCGGRGHAA
ncbi:MAG TPA: hypothetical protein VN253_04495 [Kofleriaceae bacterium]|nr:hypothetical protein [Kofleriaceae bacterium]